MPSTHLGAYSLYFHINAKMLNRPRKDFCGIRSLYQMDRFIKIILKAVYVVFFFLNKPSLFVGLAFL